MKINLFIAIIIIVTIINRSSYAICATQSKTQRLLLLCEKKCYNRNKKFKRFCEKCKSLKKIEKDEEYNFFRTVENEYKQKEINSGNIKLEDKIYVSFTSWTKRIQNCKHTVDLMMKQTLLPTKIILNLSEEEFPKKENELPKELVQEAKNNELFEIFWIKENTKVFKKIIPTMNRFPNDLVLSIDDDIEYPKFYIEEMYKTYIDYNKLCPVVGYLNKMKNTLYFHSGAFTLTSRRFYDNYLDDIYNNLILKTLDDIKWHDELVYSFALLLAGNRYKRCTSIDGNMLFKQSELNNKNSYLNYKDPNYSSGVIENMNILDNYIKEKYNKSYFDNSLLKSKIYVNVTTYPAREYFLYLMLKNFKNQTLKPDKIILWLADTEYDKNNLSNSIKKCIEENLITEIRYVPNIYGHKRWEIQKYEPNAYNINIDDDIYYPDTYVEELYNESLKYQSHPSVYLSNSLEFINTKRVLKPPIFPLSNKNRILSGMTCMPPYVFPVNSFKKVEFRDKYVKYCDDSWVNAWLINNRIDVHVLYGLNEKKWVDSGMSIPESRQVSVWRNINSKLNKNKILRKVEAFSNALYISGGYKRLIYIWPRFRFYECIDEDLINTYSKKSNIENNQIQSYHYVNQVYSSFMDYRIKTFTNFI